jgi:P-type Cu2+ transporter
MTAAAVAARPAAETGCVHCGGALPAAGRRFCCPGCEAAYVLVQDLGLGRYYERRTLDPAVRRPKPKAAPDAGLDGFVATAPDGTASLHLLVEGLHCAACVWLIETALRREPDIL